MSDLDSKYGQLSQTTGSQEGFKTGRTDWLTDFSDPENLGHSIVAEG
jgi:hypothetical protein